MIIIAQRVPPASWDCKMLGNIDAACLLFFPDLEMRISGLSNSTSDEQKNGRKDQYIETDTDSDKRFKTEKQNEES